MRVVSKCAYRSTSAKMLLSSDDVRVVGALPDKLLVCIANDGLGDVDVFSMSRAGTVNTAVLSLLARLISN